MDGAAPDGSPVDAYAALPAEPDLGVVRELIAGARSVLDLGCGTGRIADPLARDGMEVVAVDESAEMLARVRAATAVRSPIADLDLGRRFDAVLLLSHLVNSADASALVATAARHLADGGVFVAQRLEPGTNWRPGSSCMGPVTVELSEVAVDGARIDAVTDYTVHGRTWRQSWTLWERGDDEIGGLLSEAELRPLVVAGVWITATR